MTQIRYQLLPTEGVFHTATYTLQGSLEHGKSMTLRPGTLPGL